MGRVSFVQALGRCAVVVLALTALAAAPAGAARLVGGSRQAAIETAFFAHGAHRGRVVVSVRVSTIEPAWSVVKSVLPQVSGRTSTGARKPRLRAAYYHLVGRAEQIGHPPGPALHDLRHRFTVDVQYSGSGSETIAYDQLYGGVCKGLGGFTDLQQDTVAPMRWVVRYEIDPDNLLSAVRGPQGPELVPRVAFVSHGSSVTATQTRSRSVVDLTCAGSTTRWRCTTSYRLAPGAGLLSFPAELGLEIGVPMASTSTGQCDGADYTLGPSLWDSGATTALVKKLGIVGSALAGDPYKPISLTWPTNSAQQVQGFVQSPCQGDGAACTDAFTWHGVVALIPGDGA